MDIAVAATYPSKQDAADSKDQIIAALKQQKLDITADCKGQLKQQNLSHTKELATLKSAQEAGKKASTKGRLEQSEAIRKLKESSDAADQKQKHGLANLTASFNAADEKQTGQISKVNTTVRARRM